MPTRTRSRLRRVAIATVTAGLLIGSATTADASTPPDTAPTTDGPSTTAAASTTAAPTSAAPTSAAPTTASASTTAAPTTAAPTTAPAPTTTAPAPVVYPLLGVPVPDAAAYVPRPALVVKIDDGVNSHPQTGLNQADIVFEEIVEAQVTRFAAVFNSQDSDPVGNIRSGRTQDPNLLGGLGRPIFAYSGGNAGVNAALAASDFTLLTQGDGMFRVSGRGGAPYNLFANTSDLFTRGTAAGAGLATPIFEYAALGAPPTGGTPVTSIDVQLASVAVHWDWDATQGLFLRSENGSPHQLTDGQASTNNVVVVVSGYQRSAADSRSPEAITVGGGPAFFYINGQRTEGTWSRDSRTDPYTFVDSTGAPVLLTPGRTWLEIADANGYTLEDA